MRPSGLFITFLISSSNRTVLRFLIMSILYVFHISSSFILRTVLFSASTTCPCPTYFTFLISSSNRTVLRFYIMSIFYVFHISSSFILRTVLFSASTTCPCPTYFTFLISSSNRTVLRFYIMSIFYVFHISSSFILRNFLCCSFLRSFPTLLYLSSILFFFYHPFSVIFFVFIQSDLPALSQSLPSKLLQSFSETTPSMTDLYCQLLLLFSRTTIASAQQAAFTRTNSSAFVSTFAATNITTNKATSDGSFGATFPSTITTTDHATLATAYITSKP